MEGRAVGGADLSGVMNVVFLLILLSTWRAALRPLLSNFKFLPDGEETPVAALIVTPDVAGISGIISTGATATPLPDSGMGGLAVSIPTVQPTYTPYPTYTPPPTAVPEAYRFSFYDPVIGRDIPEIAEVNCESWNYETQDCDSFMRSGLDWRLYYRRAAACPYDLFAARAAFVVVSPDWLAALFPDGFECLDTGSSVVYPYIDFLIEWRSMPMPFNQTPWGTPVVLQRVR
jgi:hypothetical protein